MHTAAVVCGIVAVFFSSESFAFTASRGLFNNRNFNKLRLDAAPGPTMAKSQTPTVVAADGEVSYDEGEFLYDEDDEDDEFDDDDRDGFERTTRKSGRPLGNNE